MASGYGAVAISTPGGGSFTDIYITSAEDCSTCDVLGTPGEDGITKFDNRVLRPATVHVEGWVSVQGYGVIKKFADSQEANSLSSATCTFYNRDGGMFEDMVVKSIRARAQTTNVNMVYVIIDLQEFMKSG